MQCYYYNYYFNAGLENKITKSSFVNLEKKLEIDSAYKVLYVYLCILRFIFIRSICYVFKWNDDCNVIEG